jgi:hypothetical protein
LAEKVKIDGSILLTADKVDRFQVSGFGCQQTEVMDPDTESASGKTPETTKISALAETSTTTCQCEVAKRPSQSSPLFFAGSFFNAGHNQFKYHHFPNGK